MLLTQRSTALLLALACQSAAALAQTNPALADTRLVERFDQMVARMPPTEGLPPPERLRTERSAGDVVVKRRLNVKVNFPGNVRGAMYGGYLDGEAAVFTRSGRSLDVTVIRDGDAGVAFEGGNEAIASISGRMRIIAHEIGHMLGATHLAAESRGWWGCETNMFAVASKQRRDCLEYTAANQRAIRSYMRHGPDMSVPRRMADAPMPE